MGTIPIIYARARFEQSHPSMRSRAMTDRFGIPLVTEELIDCFGQMSHRFVLEIDGTVTITFASSGIVMGTACSSMQPRCARRRRSARAARPAGRIALQSRSSNPT